jgi:hypothetical protein
MHRQLNGFLLERYVDTRRSQPFLRRIIPLSIGSPDDPAALHNVPPRNDPLWVVCHEDRRSKGLSRRPSGLQVSKRKDSPYPLAALDQEQEPHRASGETGSRGRLGSVTVDAGVFEPKGAHQLR